MARKQFLGILLSLVGVLTLAIALPMPARLGKAQGAQIAPEQPPAWAQDLIRLHIVANSDSDEDQELKRAVRDAILLSVTPLFTDLSSVENAQAAMVAAIPRIEAIARQQIAASGHQYTVRAEVGHYEFPGKAYGSVFLPAGTYRALRVVIGEALGANWWCILFPPMCFLDWSSGVVLEPGPGTNGARSVRVSRRQAAEIVGERALAKAPVKPRIALLDWLVHR